MGEPNRPEKTARRQMAVAVARGDDRSGSAADRPVEVVQDDDTEAPTPLEYNIFAMPADYTLETLHQKWRSGYIEVPKFQRGYVWKAPQASKDRVVHDGVAGPPVFLAAGDDERPIVIGGMQRLVTVFSYLDGRYTRKTAPTGAKSFGSRESTKAAGSTARPSGTWAAATGVG